MNYNISEAIEMSNVHDKLDQFKLLSAEAVLNGTDISTIRTQSLSNLDRWAAKGSWCTAFDEWRNIMTSGTDEELISVMLGTDQNSNRLRQSPPYTGIIGFETRQTCLRAAGLAPVSPESLAKVQALIESGDLSDDLTFY